MFALGTVSLGWILALTAFFYVEKAASAGPALGRAVGAALLLAAVVLAVTRGAGAA